MGLSRIQCYFGRHIRSRGRARRMAYGWHSYCRRCGIEMIKEDGGEWAIVDCPDDEPVHGEVVGGDRPDLADHMPSTDGDTPKSPARSRIASVLRRKR